MLANIPYIILNIFSEVAVVLLGILILLFILFEQLSNILKLNDWLYKSEKNIRITSFIAGLILLIILIGFCGFLANPEYELIRQYLVLSRMPIMAGLILFIFPFLAKSSTLFSNLFVMRGVWQLLSVLVFSVFTAEMIISSSIFILKNKIEQFSPHLFIIFFITIILFLPTWYFTLKFTYDESKNSKTVKKIINKYYTCLYCLIALCLVLWGNNDFLISSIIVSKNTLNHRFWFLCILGLVIYGCGLIFNPKNLTSIENFSKPKNCWEKTIELRSAPALFYLLIMLWILTGFFSVLSFIFDPWHIPIALSIVLLSACFYLIGYIDNFFKLEEKEPITPPSATNHSSNNQENQSQYSLFKDDFHDIIQKRLKNANTKTLVIVATTGGGIQASGWTAQVLCGLQKKLGKSFTKSIGLISSVSGGSVGTMFFLDQFQKIQKDKNGNTIGGCPTKKNLKQIFKNATTDWLDAVAWGIAYPDLMRFFGLPWVIINCIVEKLPKPVNQEKIQSEKNKNWLVSLLTCFCSLLDLFQKYSDRGYALEWDWQRQLQDKTATLASWKTKVDQGEIPIPVFNATLLEDGRRFLISPLKFMNGTLEENIEIFKKQPDQDNKAWDFHTLYQYQGYDLDVTTAARLSASFPYVSPSARNSERKLTQKEYTYHVADGGYFDNGGVFTAVEWLDQHLDSLLTKKIVKRVIFIQIDAFKTPKLENPQIGFPGWFSQAIGPAKTLFNVKNSTQTARNNQEVELIKKRINEKYRSIFHTFTFRFTKEEAPLSWYLTDQQIKNLQKSWKDYLYNGQQYPDLQELKNLWKLPSY